MPRPAAPAPNPQPRTGDHRPPAAEHTLERPEMARIQCINDSCQDPNGPFVRTPDGPLCEDCYEAQDDDQ